MKNSRNFLFYALCALLFATKFAYGIDNDEDDDTVIVDIMIGLALCQESAAAPVS